MTRATCRADRPRPRTKDGRRVQAGAFVEALCAGLGTLATLARLATLAASAALALRAKSRNALTAGERSYLRNAMAISDAIGCPAMSRYTTPGSAMQSASVCGTTATLPPRDTHASTAASVPGRAP